MLTTSTGGGFFYELGESISRGLSGFTRVLSGIITFIIAFSPVLAIILFAVYLVKRYFKKRKLSQTTV
jgi:type II secretory pathway component PulF